MNSRPQALVVVLLVWAAIYLPALGSLEIKGEEGRRILPAVQMIETGDYIVPKVGSEPYLRKPPLINWLVAASFKIFGQRNEWTARLPSVLCVLAVALVFITVARVSLGALGAIAEVTLRCVPAFTLHAVDAPLPLADVLERFEELALGNDHFEFFVFPHCDVALTRTNNRTEQEPRPPSRSSAYVNDVLLTNRAFELFCRAGRRFPGQIPRFNRLVTTLAGRRERVDDSGAIFASPRLVRFTEMEYALPRAATPAAVRAVLDLIARRGFAVPFPIEVRSVAPDDAFLSTAYGRESGYVAVHMYRGMRWEPYFRAVESLMDELDGRPHWGKRHFQTAATLRGRYPEWDRFQAVRARLDPSGRFANRWTDRVLGPSVAEVPV